MKWIDEKIIKFLTDLGFASYRRHYIFGPKERLHWQKVHKAKTINALFNTRSGDIFIGDDTVIGHNCCFLTGRHLFENGKLKTPRTEQVPAQGNDIRIGCGCWIASNVTILGGVVVGRDSIVCAGAIVTKSFNSHSIIGGVPAIVIGDTRDLNS